MRSHTAGPSTFYLAGPNEKSLKKTLYLCAKTSEKWRQMSSYHSGYLDGAMPTQLIIISNPVSGPIITIDTKTYALRRRNYWIAFFATNSRKRNNFRLVCLEEVIKAAWLVDSCNFGTRKETQMTASRLFK